MRTVKLYGHLGKRFGREFKFDVQTPREAVAALRANLPGFTEYLAEHSEPGFHILLDSGVKRSLGAEELSHPCGQGVIKIIPAVAGAKNGGVLQTIVGITLIVVGVTFGYPSLVAAGISMTASGVLQMLTRVPASKSSESADNMPSYAFNGPINTTAQGNPVPVLYGEAIVGSQVVSFGLAVEDVYSVAAAHDTVNFMGMTIQLPSP